MFMHEAHKKWASVYEKYKIKVKITNSIILTALSEQNKQTWLVKMSKKGIQHSLSYNIIHYENKQTLYEKKRTKRQQDKAQKK